MTNPSQYLSKLLRPRSVAIIGASPKEGSFSRNLVKATKSLGFGGDIYLVNPRYDAIDDQPCYPAISSLPTTPDSVLYALADQRLVPALEEAAAAGVGGGVIFGRAHGGDEGGESIQDAIRSIGRSSQMSICGANCMGFVNLVDRIQVTGMPFPSLGSPSGASLVSHSGSTWSGIVGNRRDLGFDFAISAGQELVSGVADYVDYIVDLPTTKVIACVLETLREPARFLEAVAKADSKGIPVIVLKLGRSEIGQRFAVSHSGAISGSAAVYEAVLRKHNVIQVRTLDELLDTVELFARSPKLPVPSLALGTDSGGERQLIVDIATDIGLDFAKLGDDTNDKVQALLDPGMEAANPLDYWGDGADVMAPTLSAMAEDAAVGLVVMAANMPGGRAFMRQCADAVIAVKQATDKPVALMGNIASTMAPEGTARVRAAGIPVLMGTEPGLRAIKHFLDHARRTPIPKSEANGSGVVVDGVRSVLENLPAGSLSSADGFELLRHQELPVTPFSMVNSASDIDEFVGAHGYPVVLKIDDPDIPHKSDAGGVYINLRTREEVGTAFSKLKTRHPHAPVMIQKQASGRELILGMTTDPDFGPVVTLGLGGIYAEVFKDVVILPPPFDREAALAALKSLKSFPILAGARGQQPTDIDKIVDAVVAFGRLSLEVEGLVSEIEINPLMAGPNEVFAVDCLAVRTGATNAH